MNGVCSVGFSKNLHHTNSFSPRAKNQANWISARAPEDAETSDQVLAVRGALARLRPADQEILRLVTWEELSHREVATALGVSLNAVAIRFHRARKRLERILLSEGIVDIQEDEA